MFGKVQGKDFQYELWLKISSEHLLSTGYSKSFLKHRHIIISFFIVFWPFYFNLELNLIHV